MCKKRKLSNSVNDNTYPSPNKAIQQNQIDLNSKFDSKIYARKLSKRSCNKIIVTNNNDVSNDTTNVSSNYITMKTTNQNKNTKEKLGVTALIAIMEPATES